MSNGYVVRVAKLVNDISLEQEDKKYNPTEILIDSDNFKTSVSSDEEISPIQSPAETLIAVIHQTIENTDTIDKLCTPCIESKLIEVMRRNKSMTITINKLEKVHADLWRPHDLSLQSRSTYIAILICKHIRKMWTLYLPGKNDFINAFQTWLPYVEAKSEYSMKMFRADDREEFISSKLQYFCKKRGIAIRYVVPYIHEENGFAKRG